MSDGTIDNLAERLRAIALGAEQVLESTDADLVSQAADRIDRLERANGILLRKTELRECPWCGYYGTPDGLPPEDGTS